MSNKQIRFDQVPPEDRLKREWKEGMQKIRPVLNAWDPLNVVGLFEGSEEKYDDLGFQLYRILKENGDKEILSNTIMDYTINVLGLEQISDIEFHELADKISELEN